MLSINPWKPEEVVPFYAQIKRWSTASLTPPAPIEISAAIPFGCRLRTAPGILYRVAVRLIGVLVGTVGLWLLPLLHL